MGTVKGTVTRVDVVAVGRRGRFSHRLSIDGVLYSFLDDLGTAWIREGDLIEARFEKRGRYHNIDRRTLRVIQEAESRTGCGHVYMLTNPAMNGLVKIGFTTGSVVERASQLSSTTGVPTPFDVAWCLEVDVDPRVIERVCHQRLDHKRFAKEFFKCSVDFAVSEIVTSYTLVTGRFAPCPVDVQGRLAKARQVDESIRQRLLAEQKQRQLAANAHAQALTLIAPPEVSSYWFQGRRTTASIRYSALRLGTSEADDVIAGRRSLVDFSLWDVTLTKTWLVFQSFDRKSFANLDHALLWCKLRFTERGETPASIDDVLTKRTQLNNH